MHAILQQGKDSPKDVQERYQPKHGDPGEQEHERDLAQDCSHHVDGLQVDELISFETLTREVCQ